MSRAAARALSLGFKIGKSKLSSATGYEVTNTDDSELLLGLPMMMSTIAINGYVSDPDRYQKCRGWK